MYEEKTFDIGEIVREALNESLDEIFGARGGDEGYLTKDDFDAMVRENTHPYSE